MINVVNSPRSESYHSSRTNDPVHSPSHYLAGGIETIDFIEAKQLGFHLGNVVKYITRSKLKGDELQDLKKAAWYLARYIELREGDAAQEK